MAHAEVMGPRNAPQDPTGTHKGATGIDLCENLGFTQWTAHDSIVMRAKKSIAMSIEQLVREKLGDANVVRVEQELDENRDGELVLRMKVVLSDEARNTTGKELLELSEDIRMLLAREGKSGFPVLRYIPESEDRGLVPAE